MAVITTVTDGRCWRILHLQQRRRPCMSKRNVGVHQILCSLIRYVLAELHWCSYALVALHLPYETEGDRRNERMNEETGRCNEYPIRWKRHYDRRNKENRDASEDVADHNSYRFWFFMILALIERMAVKQKNPDKSLKSTRFLRHGNGLRPICAAIVTTLMRAMLSHMFWIDLNSARNVARQDESYTVPIMLLLYVATTRCIYSYILAMGDSVDVMHSYMYGSTMGASSEREKQLYQSPCCIRRHPSLVSHRDLSLRCDDRWMQDNCYPLRWSSRSPAKYSRN